MENIPLPSDSDSSPAEVSHKPAGWISLPILLIPLAFLVGLGAGYLFWGQPDAKQGKVAATSAAASASQAAQVPTAAATPAQKVVRYDIPTDGAPGMGKQGAAITLVEFSDYECPFCQKWHAEVLPKLLETYKDKIYFVYRDFPLSGIHLNATAAAEAARCAGDQGKYWDYNTKLFSGQYKYGADGFQKIASEMQLDNAQFTDCVKSRKYQAAVQKDFDFANRLGVRSTPTFFINGLAMVGAQPFEAFQQLIDQELAGNIGQ